MSEHRDCREQPEYRTYRQLRIFVSSTFNDMRQERNVLLEKVFPLVAAHCHERKAEFIGVDLRWGVSEEQSKRGETVAICMNEIDRSRPLFMAMIGERYGWIPAGAEVSVTEQEILYGALQVPENTPAGTEAFFYLRDSALTKELCGDYEPDPKQEDLRRRIRESGYPVMDGYRDLDSFGKQALDDLITAVDRLLGEEEEHALSPVMEARNDQFFLARRHAASFVERRAEQERIQELTQGGGLILLTGDPGCGKTTLLARWALEQAGQENETSEPYTFLYFAGNAGDKGWEQLARQLTQELAAHFALELPPSDDRESLRRAVALTLNMAAAKGRVYLALDQLDSLALDDDFGLSWLPEELPEGVSVLASLNNGEALERLRRRPHIEMKLGLLSPDETADVAERFLAAHSKTLSVKQLEMLKESERARNPMYLITLLNEIRHIGRHNLLTKQLEDYLSCADIRELCERMLSRLDRDYDEDHNQLPRRLLSLLLSCEDGLTEAELLPLLSPENALPEGFILQDLSAGKEAASENRPDAVLPYAKFAPLRLALEPFTVVSGGALQLMENDFRDAVFAHYLLSEEEMEHCRAQIAAWFLKHPDTPRRSWVLPRLLGKCRQYEQLYTVLCEPASFTGLWRRNRFEAGAYWADLRTQGYSPVEGYREILTGEQIRDSGLIEDLAAFFSSWGDAEAAKRLLLQITENVSSADETAESESAGNDAARCRALGLLGNLYQKEGQYREAERCYRQKEAIAAAMQDAYEQQRALGNLGLLEMMRGNPDLARKAFESVLELAGRLNQRDAQQIALGNLGNIAFSRGEYDRAKELYERQKIISQDSGNLAGVINASGALGILYMRLKESADAEREFACQEKESRRIGSAAGLSNALGNLASLAHQKGDYDHAQELLLEKRRICRQGGDFLGEQNALGNLASLYAQRRNLPAALKLARERMEMTRQNRAFRQYAGALVQLSGIEKELGLEQEAKTHRMQAVSIAKQQGFSL